jgi:hypothetical protein
MAFSVSSFWGNEGSEVLANILYFIKTLARRKCITKYRPKMLRKTAGVTIRAANDRKYIIKAFYRCSVVCLPV